MGLRGDAVPLGPPDLRGGDVPEVEIISLLGERLPRYTLRADTVFGYDHDDWLRVPLIAQLRHEVSMRDDLLHFYTTTTEESEPGSAASTPLRRQGSSPSLQQYFQYDVLQQKLKGLEEENQKLRLEATNIVTETCRYEDQEQQLMINCVEQFCTWGISASAPGSPRQERPPPRSSVFSLNLVEKLRRLGLDKVVARAETSYAQGAHGDGLT
nr:PREDICTED: huntingtin-associated protein 1 [Apteryx mantelli mantelli]